MHRSLRDAGVALSLSNLCFLSAWLVLVNPNHYSYYTWPQDPGFREFGSLALDILLLALVFWLFATLARRSKKPAVARFSRLALWLIIVIPLNSLLHNYSEGAVLSTFSRHKPFAVLMMTVALFMLWGVTRYLRSATRAVISILLIVSPFALVNFASALWLKHKYGSVPESFSAKSAPPLVQTRSSPHILWIIFDELDQRVAFDARPSGLALPELDRLRSEAVFAASAYPPAGFTMESIPALISGRFVSKVTPLRPDELELQFADQTISGWSAQPSVFSQTREMGFTTAVVGWYHPYCRVLGSTLDSCRWEPVIDQVNPVRGQFTVSNGMWLWARSALYTVPFMFRILKRQYDEGRQEDHIGEYTALMKDAREVWARPDLNLSLLHFPVPHHPWIYDRISGTLSKRPELTYFDNLALADRTLGELRESLEAAGLWEQSAILVTSDHWWREAPMLNGRRDHRVPFIVKVPGQKQGRTFGSAINTIITHDLLLALLQGKLSDADATLKWLSQHRSVGESEFTKNLP